MGRSELQRNILGTLLLYGGIADVADILEPSNFTSEGDIDYPLIYKTILDMYAEAEPIDIVTLSIRLKGVIEVAKIAALTDSATTLIMRYSIQLLSIDIASKYTQLLYSIIKDHTLNDSTKSVLSEIHAEINLSPIDVVIESAPEFLKKIDAEPHVIARLDEFSQLFKEKTVRALRRGRHEQAWASMLECCDNDLKGLAKIFIKINKKLLISPDKISRAERDFTLYLESL